jgi:hypothetical protein
VQGLVLPRATAANLLLGVAGGGRADQSAGGVEGRRWDQGEGEGLAQDAFDAVCACESHGFPCSFSVSGVLTDGFFLGLQEGVWVRMEEATEG